MRKHILAAIALLAIPTGLHAQEAPSQIEGLCGLSLAAQSVYEGACVFEKQADEAGAKTIEVQMDNGLNVTFLRPANSNQWTVTTLEGTAPVAIEPQPGEVVYEWEGVTLTAKSPGGTAAAEPEANTGSNDGGGLSVPGVGNIPGTGNSKPSSNGDGIVDRVVDRAADRAVRKGTDAALQQLFGF